jgi:hypothetical protein
VGGGRPRRHRTHRVTVARQREVVTALAHDE